MKWRENNTNNAFDGLFRRLISGLLIFLSNFKSPVSQYDYPLVWVKKADNISADRTDSPTVK